MYIRSEVAGGGGQIRFLGRLRDDVFDLLMGRVVPLSAGKRNAESCFTFNWFAV